MVRLLRYGFVLVVLCSFLVACGGGGGGGGSAGVATGTGVFVDSPVEGMKYVSGTITGVTDQNGSFGCEVGLTGKFFVGEILVGGAPAVGSRGTGDPAPLFLQYASSGVWS